MGPTLSVFRCPDKTNLGPHRPPAPRPFRQQQNTEPVDVGVGVIHGVSSKGGESQTILSSSSTLGELGPVTSAVYGSLLLGGGLFAYGRSGSKESLAGGCTGAVLMGTAYYLMQTPETRQIGYALGFGSSFLFASVFGIRLAATRKLAPAGPLLGISALALVVFISAYLRGTI